jgi:protein TonB
MGKIGGKFTPYRKTMIKASWMVLAAALALSGCSKKSEPAKAAENAKAETPVAAASQAPAAASQAVPLTTRPKLYYYPKPVFPSSMQRICKEGEVCVSMLVSAEGIPSDIKIDASSDPAFSKAMMDVVPLWRFEPATRDGVAVAHIFKVAIPFYINSRPINLSDSVMMGQPELFGVKRPAHPGPGRGAAQAVAEFTLASDTIVTDVKIVESTGFIDEKKLVEALSQWVFMPSRGDTARSTSKVKAQILFTEAGNVLIQYPYPAPKAETAAPSQVSAPADK